MVKIICLLLVFFALPVRAQLNKSHSERSVTSDSLAEHRLDSLSRLERPDRARGPKEFLKNEIAFGGTLGTPGGLNFIAAKYFPDFSIRAEIGAAPLIMAQMVGGQCDLSYVLARDNVSVIEISAIGFRSLIQSVDNLAGTDFWGYGVGFSLDLGGFFFQISCGHSWSHDRESKYTDSINRLINASPMTMQIGYLH